MTNQYRWVTWNRHKFVYDAAVVTTVVLSIGVFVGATAAVSASTPDPATLLIRALGSTAIAMLHVVLCIGPLARLTDLAAPLLYNRRHLGVATFLVALLHAVLVLGYYGGFGVVDPVTAVLFEGRAFGSVATFPFELLGFGGLLILFAMAATSHDFWLANLSPSVWKALHMAVYPAYALVCAHAVLGALRDGEAGPVWVLTAGMVVVGTLHAAAGVRETARDSAGIDPSGDDASVMGSGAHADDQTPWVRVCEVGEIPERRARVVCLKGRERVAVFRHEGRVSAVTNVCAHQGGPLGEGRVVDGCITCPWHGYQYDPTNGQSPPPFTERIATYRVRVEGRDVLLDPRPLSPGTPVEPALYEATPDDESLFEPVTRRLVRGDPDVDLGLNADEPEPDPEDAIETAVDMTPPPEAGEPGVRPDGEDRDAEDRKERGRG